MSAELWVQIAAAIIAGGLIQALFNYNRDRRAIRARDDLSEATNPYSVEITGMSALQAKLVYLQNVIDSLNSDRIQLRADNEAKDERIRALRTEVWALEQKVQDARTEIRALDATCVQLQDQLSAIREGHPDL